MDKDFPILLEKRENKFYCSIPELKLVFQSENLNAAYEGIQLLKDEHLKACNEYEDFCGTGPTKKKSAEQTIKNSVIVMFFLLLTIGIASHLVSAFLANVSHKIEDISEKVSMKLDVPRSLKALSSLTPEEKDKKLKRFQKKMDNAQKILKEVRPFIEVSKPFLRDLQDSFDLKRPRS